MSKKIEWIKRGMTANNGLHMQEVCDQIADATTAINNSLQKPTTAPSATQLVAVDNTNTQTMLSIGNGLSIENDTLKANSENGAVFRHSVEITIDYYTIRCVLYSKNNATVTATTLYNFIQNNYIEASGLKLTSDRHYIITGIQFLSNNNRLSIDNYYLTNENNNIKVNYENSFDDISQAYIIDGIAEI